MFFKNVHSLGIQNTAFMFIFCQKNLYSPKNTVISCKLFQFFFMKNPVVIPNFGQKNVNSVKTTLFMGQQSQ